MRTSIRSFLLTYLLIGIFVTSSVMVATNLYLNHKKLRAHFDTQLVIDTLTIEALLNDNPTKADLAKIQHRIDNIPSTWELIYNSNQHVASQKELSCKILFQVWDKNHDLILYPPCPSVTSLTPKNIGFGDVVINGIKWRVFSTYNHLTGITVMTAERYDFHRKLEEQISYHSILVLFLSMPLLGILIWIIVGQGLSSLKQITKELKNRAPGYLNAVSTLETPREIQPLIDELNRLFVKVKYAFEREERFAADAAHELRTPLAALRAHVHVALNASTDEERNNALNKIIKGIDRGTHVITQLLTLSRTAKHNDKEIKLVPVNLNSVAADTIAELVPLAREKKIDIELISDERNPPLIQGDAVTLGVLIKNLVDNSIRYLQIGGLIQVYIKTIDQLVLLQVVDNGPGIPDEQRKLVFERFYRGVDNTAPGSGLGLSIVQQVVNLHQAKISLTSPPSGKGLEVDVTFNRIKN